MSKMDRESKYTDTAGLTKVFKKCFLKKKKGNALHNLRSSGQTCKNNIATKELLFAFSSPNHFQRIKVKNESNFKHFKRFSP